MGKIKHEEHPNSRPITIFRAGSFLARAQGKEAAEFLNTGRMSIGSYFVNNDTPISASGLTRKEEELLIPDFINCMPDEREYRKLRSEFCAGIDTKVPAVTGITLQTGLEEDNDKPVSKTNMPLEPMDYIRWRHAIGHPEVAESQEVANSRAIKKYYIFDPSAVQTKKVKGTQQKDAAMHIYFQIKEDLGKVDMLLTLLGTDVRTFTGTEEHKAITKVEALRELADSDSKNFVDVFNEKDFETRYWIKTMTNVGVLVMHGPRFVDAETKSIVGNSLDETISFFMDEANSEAVILYKARMQEYLKRPIAKTHKRTEVPLNVGGNPRGGRFA